MRVVRYAVPDRHPVCMQRMPLRNVASGGVRTVAHRGAPSVSHACIWRFPLRAAQDCTTCMCACLRGHKRPIRGKCPPGALAVLWRALACSSVSRLPAGINHHQPTLLDEQHPTCFFMPWGCAHSTIDESLRPAHSGLCCLKISLHPRIAAAKQPIAATVLRFACCTSRGPWAWGRGPTRGNPWASPPSVVLQPSLATATALLYQAEASGLRPSYWRTFLRCLAKPRRGGVEVRAEAWRPTRAAQQLAYCQAGCWAC